MRTFEVTEAQHTQILAALFFANLHWYVNSVILECVDVLAPSATSTAREQFEVRRAA